MNKIDRLTNDNPEFSVNLIDLIRKFDPTESGKFTQFLIKRVEEQITQPNGKIDNEANAIIESLTPPNCSYIDKYLLMVMYHTIGRDNLYALWEFQKHLNENRIEEKDIQKYKNWDDIFNSVLGAELKVKEKELRKQIDVLYDNGNWIVLKPLSFNASLAYGSATKWCTASKNNASYFYQYSTNGMLIYVMNRKTNYKFAMYVEMNKKKFNNKFDISFWDAADNKTESLELDIPDEIMSVLRDQINDKTKAKPNKYFFSKEELARMPNNGLKLDHEPMVMDEGEQMEVLMGGELPPDDDEIVELTELAPPRPVNGRPRATLQRRQLEQLHDVGDEAEEDVMYGVPADRVNAEREVIQRRIVRNDEQEIIMVDVINALRDDIDDDTITDLQDNGDDAELYDEEVARAPMIRPAHLTDDRISMEPRNLLKTKKSQLNKVEYTLAPHIPEVDPDASKIFVPAPWLNKIEIDVINSMMFDFSQQKYKMGHSSTMYAYPNGEVIIVRDKISKNVIYERNIELVRNGRDEKTPFNPFGNIIQNKNMMDNLEINHNMETEEYDIEVQGEFAGEIDADMVAYENNHLAIHRDIQEAEREITQEVNDDDMFIPVRNPDGAGYHANGNFGGDMMQN